ncbi:MAG: hypothetical protein M9894_33855 [Planctomycetes bacterium]|nr:hypothetical protein [Planctomycetota bacterium]
MFDKNGQEVATTQVQQPFMFTGRRWDFEEGSGLYYYRLRYYDPQAGRFVSRDPLGLWGDPAQSGNGQSYCGNNPVNRVDPTGLTSPLPPLGPIVQGIDGLLEAEIGRAHTRAWDAVEAKYGERVLNSRARQEFFNRSLGQHLRRAWSHYRRYLMEALRRSGVCHSVATEFVDEFVEGVKLLWRRHRTGVRLGQTLLETGRAMAARDAALRAAGAARPSLPRWLRWTGWVVILGELGAFGFCEAARAEETEAEELAWEIEDLDWEMEQMMDDLEDERLEREGAAVDELDERHVSPSGGSGW